MVFLRHNIKRDDHYLKSLKKKIINVPISSTIYMFYTFHKYLGVIVVRSPIYTGTV